MTPKSDEFPLCEKAGLKVIKLGSWIATFAVDAKEVEAYLAGQMCADLMIKMNEEVTKGWLPIKPKEPEVPERDGVFKEGDFTRRYFSDKDSACIAEEANRIHCEWLEKNGVVVYSTNRQVNWHEFMPSEEMNFSAIIINIKPIEQPDSWEKLGPELISALDGCSLKNNYKQPLLERAKKLLDKEK